MKLFIKNMVCSRCRMAVRNELEKAGIPFSAVELGEVEISGKTTPTQLKQLEKGLNELGFELIDDKKSRIIEKIKNHVIQLVHHSDTLLKTNLSDYLADKLHYDYTYLSNLFSAIENTTIEKYYITQRIEKIKELLVYDEMSLSEIADKLGYSSGAYLSAQFKKVTGLTPSHYKALKEHKRKNIEEL
ncbi:MAG TPA: AraC family transcriptional regulator [Flavobacteriales bacterium]|nr:AraC family transcriptional regulator [Flavobacteriales bacterium]